MNDDLAQVLADARGEAAVLRRSGHQGQADSIERLCDRVTVAAEDYLRFIPEEDAVLRSGRSHTWFRSRFQEWEREGNARWEHESTRRRGRGRRMYRQLVVPHRANPTAAREAGRAA